MSLYIIRKTEKWTAALNEDELKTLIAVLTNGIVDENKRYENCEHDGK